MLDFFLRIFPTNVKCFIFDSSQFSVGKAIYELQPKIVFQKSNQFFFKCKIRRNQARIGNNNQNSDGMDTYLFVLNEFLKKMN